ncbi:unnamed protein product [Penicillium roqueforti FM164]|uniref:Uncharacterized protein n=1 Tax=Penicillium roqueforti (strain FM164) TaxID=1365484 RepID=W6QPX7_PENRF|nr:unnamed protein product [Penicillium roqueforti FM164]
MLLIESSRVRIGDKGELKILVNVANKTAYYNLESFKRI